MKYTFLLLLGLLAFATSCEDPELDPLQFDKIKQGSIIALRGAAVNNLNDRTFLGAVDRVSKTADPAAETFTFDADYLSADPSSLARVKIYARATQTGPRVQVATVEGSAFTIKDGSTYPRASISIPLTTILSALGVTLADLQPNQYLFIESDLELTDGSTVLASSVVNSSLFESAQFYPAHDLRLLITE